MKAAFPIGHPKSILLLTSRNIEVAKHVDPEGFLYQPRILSEDESWELLAMKALTKKDLTGKVSLNLVTPHCYILNVSSLVWYPFFDICMHSKLQNLLLDASCAYVAHNIR